MKAPGNLKGLGVFVILFNLRLCEPSAPVSFSPNTDGRSYGFQNNVYSQPSLQQSQPFSSGQSQSRREPISVRRAPSAGVVPITAGNTVQTRRPGPSLQPRRLRNSLQVDGSYPAGRIDSVPGIRDIPRTKPIPPRQPPKPTQVRAKSAPPNRAVQEQNRIRKPLTVEGYRDASAGTNSFPLNQVPVGKVDNLGNNFLGANNKNTKLDRISQRKSPLAPPPRPGNPFIHEDPFRRNDETKNRPPRLPFEKPSIRDVPDYGNNVAPYNRAKNPPPRIPFEKPSIRDVPDYDNNVAPYNRAKSPPPRLPFEKPSIRDVPDYDNNVASYNRPIKQQFSSPPNSSFDAPGSVDFVPLERGINSPRLSRNPSQSPLAFPADPFQSSGFLKRDRNFPFAPPTAFSQRSSRPRSSSDFSPTNIFHEFPNPLATYAPKVPFKPKAGQSPQQRYQSELNGGNGKDSFVKSNNSPAYNNPRTREGSGGRGNQGSVNNNDQPYFGNRGQCFQYSFPAKAYRLSDLAKGYPKEEIQKEIDRNPHLSPLVGLEAKAVGNDPFTFDAPISSHFDFSGFGFQKDATTADKYSHLKNVKTFPGNLRQEDLKGRYPSSMLPLDSACPSTEYNLHSFFHQGSDCYIINPDFQQITYHRCTRQDCNFCGVNRGLSACVEEYRWTSLVAFCAARSDGKRISPMRLLLPVGCSCQHFLC